MTFVITERCICVKDASCVAACPVDCIAGTQDDPMMFIDPALCIDCAACAPVCPVNAIYNETELPPEQAQLTAINRQYFSDRDGALDQLRSRTS